MTKNQHRIVFRMDYAMELKNRGHKIAMIMPNPQKPNYNCWVFEIDETFDEDFEKIRGGKS